MGGVAMDTAGERPLAEAAVSGARSAAPRQHQGSQHLERLRHRAGGGAGREGRRHPYVLTEADPFAAIDLDHCRHPDTHSIDVWAQNFLDVARHTYSEVTPTGAGCRIWGLTATVPIRSTENSHWRSTASRLPPNCSAAPTKLLTDHRLSARHHP